MSWAERSNVLSVFATVLVCWSSTPLSLQSHAILIQLFHFEMAAGLSLCIPCTIEPRFKLSASQTFPGTIPAAVVSS